MAGCSNTISTKSPKFQNFYFLLYMTFLLKFEKIKNTKTIEKEKRADSKEVQPHTQKREFSESAQVKIPLLEKKLLFSHTD